MKFLINYYFIKISKFKNSHFKRLELNYRSWLTLSFNKDT